MNNFKLLSKVLIRNKFYKNFIIAITVLFSAFELYMFISSIIEKYSDSIGLLQNTLFTLYFLNVFLMIFSYECFSKINLYKESLNICKKSIISVYKNELLLFICYIAFLTVEASIINIIYIIANNQFSFALLFHTVSRLLCYFFLCLVTAVFIGLMLSVIRKKYIAYIFIIIFALSEIELMQISSMHIFEDYGKDFSKFFEFFFIVPHSLRWTPNEQIGLALDINKISQLLFFIVLSVLVIILASNKSKKEKLWKSITCSILCLCLLVGYFIPVSIPKMDLSASSDSNDDLYYIYNKDCQREEDADFHIEKYDLTFSAGLNLKGKAKVYIDNKNLQKYKFTLYHKYKVFKVTNQNGTPLEFTQDYDYLTILNDNTETEYLCIEYYGGSPQYYCSYAGIFLPGNFSYYPIPGFHKIFEDFYGFIDNSLPYDTAFNVEVHALKKVYCNLEEKGNNKFSGNAKSITILSGFYDTLKINDTTILYPYFVKTYQPNELNKYMGAFTKENKNIKNIFIVPYLNLSQYEQIRTYDNYLFTASKFDLEQRSFESKIAINKKEFYILVCNYYTPNADEEYLHRIEEDYTDNQKIIASILKSLFASEYKDEAAEAIDKYLIDNNDKRTPLEFLTELEARYA